MERQVRVLLLNAGVRAGTQATWTARQGVFEQKPASVSIIADPKAIVINHESADEHQMPTLLSATPIPGHDRLKHSRGRWPTTNRYPQPHGPATIYRGNFFAGMDVLERQNPFCGKYPCPTKSSGIEYSPIEPVPTNHRGSNDISLQNAQNSHRPGICSSRTGLMPEWRFQPYQAPYVHFDEHRNPEPGP